MRIIVGTYRVYQVAACNQTSFGYIACPDNHLPCISSRLVRVHIEVAGDGINPDNLIDIARHNAVIVAFLLHILIVFESTFIDKEQRPADIPGLLVPQPYAPAGGEGAAADVRGMGCFFRK